MTLQRVVVTKEGALATWQDASSTYSSAISKKVSAVATHPLASEIQGDAHGMKRNARATRFGAERTDAIAFSTHPRVERTWQLVSAKHLDAERTYGGSFATQLLLEPTQRGSFVMRVPRQPIHGGSFATYLGEVRTYERAFAMYPHETRASGGAFRMHRGAAVPTGQSSGCRVVAYVRTPVSGASGRAAAPPVRIRDAPLCIADVSGHARDVRSWLARERRRVSDKSSRGPNVRRRSPPESKHIADVP